MSKLRRASLDTLSRQDLIEQLKAYRIQKREQDNEIFEMRKDLDDLRDMNALLLKMGNHPEQLKAGVVAFPKMDPVDYQVRLELFETGSQNPFLTSVSSVASAAWTIDSNNPHYLTHILVAQYRDAGTAPLGKYLPVGGFGPLANQFGIDFRWKLNSSLGDRKWQKDWRDGYLFGGDDHQGYRLPIEQRLFSEEQVEITVEALADAAGEDTYRTFVTFIGYKMLKVKPGTADNG